MMLFFLLILEIYSAHLQTLQRDGLCALQKAFFTPDLLGWRSGVCPTDDINMQDWEGVTWRQNQDNTWSVTALILQNRNLTGSIPTEISYLTDIENLDLSSNFLTGTIPTEIGLLSKLSQILLHTNKFSGSIPSQFFTMENIYVLSLAQNNFSGTLATEVGLSPSNMYGMDLSENILTGSIPTEIAKISAMRFFSVGHNKMTGTIPTELGRLRQISALTWLDLQSNQFSGTIPSEYGNLDMLNTLYLSKNLMFGDVAVIGEMPNLEVLLLSENKFEGSLNFLSNLPRISQVFLSHNLIGGTLDFQFPPLLAYLQISENNITGNAVFRDMKVLQSLLLDNNQLTSITVINSPILFSIHAQNNNITDVNIDLLPNCLRIDLSYNSIVSLPTFISFGSSLVSLYELNLKGNKIGGQFANTIILNTALYSVDLSFNAIEGEFINFLFYTPIPALNTSGGTCYCIPPPVKREINMIANRVSVTSIALWEINGVNYYKIPGIRLSLPVCNGPFTEVSGKSLCVTADDVVFGFDNSAEIEIYPQDVDECRLGTHECQQTCIDGWFPALSYTCGCGPNFILTNDLRSCIATTANVKTILGLALGITLPILIILGIVIAIVIIKLRKRNRAEQLKLLPKEISWSFLEFEQDSSKWEFQGTEKAGIKHGYYFKECDRNGVDWVDRVLRKHLGNVGKDLIHARAIFQIYNENLTTSFINQWLTIGQRAKEQSNIFAKENWRDKGSSADQDQRRRVKEIYLQRVNECEWNKGLDEREFITLGVHGTDFPVAKMIAQTGFANISSLDEGYYGKGIYFSTSMLYCFPYFSSKRNPSLILSYICLGNIYPVIESHNGARSISGIVNHCELTFIGSLHSGCNSHYVCTNREGLIYDFKKSNDEVFDEVVIFQESQVVPAFLLEIKSDNFEAIMKKFARDVPNVTPSRDGDNDYVGVSYESGGGNDKYIPLNNMSNDGFERI